MATEMKNKWVFMFSYETKISIINWAINWLLVLHAAIKTYLWEVTMLTDNFRDPVFRESSNLMWVSRLIATVVIDVPIAFDFGDA